MLDALLDGSIALCDAGTGVGKTYAYLAAGAAFHRFRTDQGRPVRPILISTSSIALQNAIQMEYLPILSDALTVDGLISEPLLTVIRKGKSHYVCDYRLERRLGQMRLCKKNEMAIDALFSLRDRLDIDSLSHLSGFDRERVCVPKVCNCGQKDCRYLAFLEDCDSGEFSFQICNHNLLLADAIHRGTGRSPILPDACAAIIDEGHKLPDAARQMFGATLEAGDYPQPDPQPAPGEVPALAAESLAELSAPLLRLMNESFDSEKSFLSLLRLGTSTSSRNSFTACFLSQPANSCESCPTPWSCSPRRTMGWCFTPWRTGGAAPCCALWSPTWPPSRGPPSGTRSGPLSSPPALWRWAGISTASKRKQGCWQMDG